MRHFAYIETAASAAWRQGRRYRCEQRYLLTLRHLGLRQYDNTLGNQLFRINAIPANALGKIYI